MHEIIQQVLASERQGKTILDEATNEAQRLLSQAQARARDLVAQARQTAQREAQDIVAAAEKTAEQEKEQQLARMTEQFQIQMRLTPETTQHAVEAAVACICGATTASSRIGSVNPERTGTATPEEPAKELIHSQLSSRRKFSIPPTQSG